MLSAGQSVQKYSHTTVGPERVYTPQTKFQCAPLDAPVNEASYYHENLKLNCTNTVTAKKYHNKNRNKLFRKIRFTQLGKKCNAVFLAVDNVLNAPISKSKLQNT